MRTDVFVVGAGPAGLAAAIAAADAGFSVEVADTLQPPLDKPCGEGLMPDALAALARLGVTLDGTETAPFRGIRFIGSAQRMHVTRVEARFPEGTGRGIRRALLSQLLLDRATALGVKFRWGTTVRALECSSVHFESNNVHFEGSSNVRFDEGSVEARFIVGADGHHSQVRRLAGLDKRSIRSKRIGLRRHYRFAPGASRRDEMVEVFWAENSQAYVTPVAPDEVCIAIISRHKMSDFEAELQKFPVLLAQLEGAAPSDAARGSVTLDTRVHRVTHDRVALLGDASGGVDALTGEGMALGFRQAFALADALRADNLKAYAAAHKRIGRLPHLMSGSMLLLDRFPLVRNRVLDAFDARPATFASMLHMHVGDRMPPLLGRDGALTLASRLLLA